MQLAKFMLAVVSGMLATVICWTVILMIQQIFTPNCDPHSITVGMPEAALRGLCGKPKSIVDTSYTSAKRLEYKDLVVYVSHADSKVVQWEWTER